MALDMANPRGLGEAFPGFPHGWFAVAFSRELQPGTTLTRRIAGQELVLWRERAGGVHAIYPFCPHLGSHLGRNGKVIGNELECQFHGWRFDGRGRCVRTPASRPPRSLQPLRGPSVGEHHGVVMVYYPLDTEPEWHIEPVPSERAGRWRRPLQSTIRTPGHVQDVGENSVDTEHLRFLHRFRELTVVHPTRYRDHRAYVQYKVARAPRWLPALRAEATFDIRTEGLGFAVGDIAVRVPLYRCAARLMMLPTQIDATTMELRISAALHRPPRGGGRRLLRPVAWLVEPIVARVVFWTFAFDVRRDVRIWRYKSYLSRPTIARHDGPIGTYRRWVRRFYPPPQRV